MGIRLSKRLEAAADFVPEGACLADVGCDHGYLSLVLLKWNRIRRAYCLDMKEGPLRRAAENARAEGYFPGLPAAGTGGERYSPEDPAGDTGAKTYSPEVFTEDAGAEASSPESPAGEAEEFSTGSEISGAARGISSDGCCFRDAAGREIRFRRSDGFQALSPGEADAAVICGMGGSLIMKILSDMPPEVRSGIRRFIFGPQSELPAFRAFLLREGFPILEEAFVREGGKDYTLILSGNTCLEGHVLRSSAGGPSAGDGTEPYTSVELKYGRFLLKRKEPLLLASIEREKEMLEEILARSALPLKRRKELEAELHRAEEGIRLFPGRGTV